MVVDRNCLGQKSEKPLSVRALRLIESALATVHDDFA
jgi:hypothetical protein